MANPREEFEMLKAKYENFKNQKTSDKVKGLIAAISLLIFFVVLAIVAFKYNIEYILVIGFLVVWGTLMFLLFAVPAIRRSALLKSKNLIRGEGYVMFCKESSISTSNGVTTVKYRLNIVTLDGQENVCYSKNRQYNPGDLVAVDYVPGKNKFCVLVENPETTE